jgi:hypothetical protein
MPTPGAVPGRLPPGEMSSADAFRQRYGIGGGGSDLMRQRYGVRRRKGPMMSRLRTPAQPRPWPRRGEDAQGGL